MLTMCVLYCLNLHCTAFCTALCTAQVATSAIQSQQCLKVRSFAFFMLDCPSLHVADNMCAALPVLHCAVLPVLHFVACCRAPHQPLHHMAGQKQPQPGAFSQHHLYTPYADKVCTACVACCIALCTFQVATSAIYGWAATAPPRCTLY